MNLEPVNNVDPCQSRKVGGDLTAKIHMSSPAHQPTANGHQAGWKKTKLRGIDLVYQSQESDADFFGSGRYVNMSLEGEKISLWFSD